MEAKNILFDAKKSVFQRVFMPVTLEFFVSGSGSGVVSVLY
jgi:hypothetical protein